MIEFVVMLFLLLVAFAVADFGLQTDAIAKGKNWHRKTEPPPGQKYIACWPYFLSAHALIHAGGVYIVTGQPVLAFGEFGAHWLIDFAKCENWTNPHGDQALHLACRILWAALAVWVL